MKRLQVSSGVLTAVSCDNGVNGDNDEGDDDDDGRPRYLRQILLKVMWEEQVKAPGSLRARPSDLHFFFFFYV